MTNSVRQQPGAKPRRRTTQPLRLQHRLRTLLRPREYELLLLLALFVIALLARWPYLMRLPHFTDEIGEIRWALKIYQGVEFPLTAQVKYFGPLHHYLLAACFWLFGLSATLPRTLICVLGCLTVVLTYLVGKELVNWRVGAVGALLLATLPQHIVVNSHVAWENSTTPFYATLCYYTLLRAIRALPAAPVRHRDWSAAGRWLLLCGFVGGLMLQTHVGTVLLAPALLGALLYACWRRRSWGLLQTPWPYLSAGATVVAYSPVLIANVQDGLSGFHRARGRDYAYVSTPTLETYLNNLKNLCFELARMVSNPFRMPERALHYLTSPYMLLAIGLVIVGLLILLRQHQPLPALAIFWTALVMPYYNHAYGVDGDRYLVTGRYVAYLLPLLMIASATGAVALATTGLRLLRQLLATGRRNHLQRWQTSLLALVPTLLILALIVYPIIPLRRYYTHESQQDPDNATFLETAHLVKGLRNSTTPVVLGPLLSKVDLKDGATALEVLEILLTLSGVPHTASTTPAATIATLAATLPNADVADQPLAILTRDDCFAIREKVPLLRISDRLLLRELYWDLPSYYGVYRYTPNLLPDQRCLPAEGATAGD